MIRKMKVIPLMVLLLSSLFVNLVYADIDGDDITNDLGNNRKISQKVYDAIKAAAEARRDELLYLLEKDLSPEILNSLQQALTAMKKAEETEGADLKASAQYYLDALKLFRSTWQQYLDYNPDAVYGAPDDTEDSDKPKGDDPEDLDDEIKKGKHQLIVQYQDGLLERITSMYQHVEDIVDSITDDDARKLETILGNSDKKIRQVLGKINDGEYSDAIDDLSSLTLQLNAGFDYLGDNDVSKLLKNVDHLEAKVQKTLKEKEEKEKKGQDTSDEDDELDQLNGDIKDNKINFKEKKDKDKTENNSNGASTNNDNDEEKTNNGKKPN
ncbi:MAG: hypothetical protein NWE89_08525 [Candidatus Bathyarchaeota archaeon]|nr:hypothetical protein [Candidatus Bathyarchaeota archaeon]